MSDKFFFKFTFSLAQRGFWAQHHAGKKKEAHCARFTEARICEHVASTNGQSRHKGHDLTAVRRVIVGYKVRLSDTRFTMFGFGEASDLVLKRLFKVLIKKHLAQFLATEVDVSQLGVQLSAGVVELRECLLDVDYVNERLASYRRQFSFVEMPGNPRVARQPACPHAGRDPRGPGLSVRWMCEADPEHADAPVGRGRPHRCQAALEATGRDHCAARRHGRGARAARG